MQIIVDSQEKCNQKILEEFCKQQIPFSIKKMSFGDYSFICNGINYVEKVVIERKKNLGEIAGNLSYGRRRFENEFIRAMEANAKIYLMIEDEKAREKMLLRRRLDKYIKKVGKEYVWIENKEFPDYSMEKVYKKTWRSGFYANSMINSIESWINKYNINILFVEKKESGKQILNIFNKYLEEVGTND